MSIEDFDYGKLVVRAHGMLDPAVYREISMAAARSDGTVLEVGTAHGASAIAAAVGLGAEHRVLTIDQLVGGSREAYGGIEENARIIRDNFAHYGLGERVELLIGTSTEVAKTLDAGSRYGMLILDADGAIDRDFMLFFNALTPGGPVVIDDFGLDATRVSSRGGKDVFVDQKHRLTTLLVGYFEEKGLLARNKVVNDTYFGTKSVDLDDDVAFDRDEILGVYRRLIFSSGVMGSGLSKKVLKSLKHHAPGVHFALKKLSGRMAT